MERRRGWVSVHDAIKWSRAWSCIMAFVKSKRKARKQQLRKRAYKAYSRINEKTSLLSHELGLWYMWYSGKAFVLVMEETTWFDLVLFDSFFFSMGLFNHMYFPFVQILAAPGTFENPNRMEIKRLREQKLKSWANFKRFRNDSFGNKIWFNNKTFQISFLEFTHFMRLKSDYKFFW